ncbi:4a-hydroxytetrahydrobiopterin dehydratase [Dactylosporangium sucinum]|uniref:Putative pterin-4-alpha-carbinolamine dehydratase n=1 Tax=Dactylosporangium sucinum TaxID=1424081 RepID=A0A917TR60_9ACTN|nr:4a-hydroxytetrahydrobiopterin dehydratase [Dactylosporangium sucinum]GGM32626.1 putative pterin-4-alpha-carbinolamine dehydratase [Dactylosporangium sucinum]
MADVLGAEQVAAALGDLRGWAGDASAIERSVTAESFLDGIRLVAEVAHVAEQADHHPDIDIRWRTVTFRLSTHSAGGVTEKDLALARQINELIG